MIGSFVRVGEKLIKDPWTHYDWKQLFENGHVWEVIRKIDRDRVRIRRPIRNQKKWRVKDVPRKWLKEVSSLEALALQESWPNHVPNGNKY